MYVFDEHRVGLTVNERFTHMIHQLAVAAACCYPNRVCLIPTAEEMAVKMTAMRMSIEDDQPWL
jgi:hypothetical protein